jgi:RNA polymerase sigma-70 factor (ECF subfamily)
MESPLFDENYLRALANRREDIEQHLFAHFSRPVRAKLRTRLRSPELVQDALQETFLRVYTYFRAGKTLDNPASLPGFIHAVCHNTALELLRSHTRHPQVPEDAPDPVDSSLDPEGRAAAAERKEIVRRILRELPEKDHELLQRVFLDEEDKDAVCRDLRIDRDYLRVLLYRARTRMKAALVRSDMNREARGAAR